MVVNAEIITELIKAIPALAWPVILAIVLWNLFPAVKAIVSSRAFSVKVAGMEVSVQDATEQLRAQIEDLQRQVISLRSGEQTRGANAPLDLPPVEVERSPRILWVDDKPANNAFEIAQLMAFGFEIFQAVSTDDALALLERSGNFDAIISDMGRWENGGYRSHAGLALLNTLRQKGSSIPFLIYTTANFAEKNALEVEKAGGDGATASAVELVEWVRSKARPNTLVGAGT